jgi:hypothetical protein
MHVSLRLACFAPLVLQAVPAHAMPFAMNGQIYNVEHITGTGSDKALLELDFGTNAVPDAHLFGFQWDPVTAPSGRDMLLAMQTDAFGLSFTETTFGAPPVHFLNTLWYNTNQPPDSYPTSFWNWFTSGNGQSWTSSDFGFDATLIVNDGLSQGSNDGFYAWAVQHDDPNFGGDFNDPNYVFLPPSHFPAAITAVPEPTSLLLLAMGGAALFTRHKR